MTETEFDRLKKQWAVNSNWRAHVANYVELKKQRKENYSPEQYCKEQKINYGAFKLWWEYIEKEDRYIFHMSFATEYINRAKLSLDLVEKYKDVSELRMALLRDVITAYAAPFTKSQGRFFNRFSLNEIENIVPDSLQNIHKKICGDRDQIVAHCDLGARNPRVGRFGISIRMAGYYWEDYKPLIPDFSKLIVAVQKNLQKYNRENFPSVEKYFEGFIHPPKCVGEDPGLPSGLTPNKH